MLFNILPRFLITLSIILLRLGSFTVWLDISILIEWSVLPIISVPIKITLLLDPTGLIYRAVVLFISSNVLRFSKFYIKEDPFINRFTILVLLFIISINFLIFIPHFIALLLGWDGLGITSFILVVYYQSSKSLGAGIITALTNRIGDVIILISIALCLDQGHWNILHMWNSVNAPYQIIFITVAACTKSAQIPFSRWLPAAIAAPTPVSALVHSSTLVTGGVFLLIRFFPFLDSFWIFKPLILFIGVSTTIMAGIRATIECDIKKIIALSTLSQLGVIITALGLGLPNLATFHIITHALFKALLFICAGEIIANHNHAQDLRWIGNLVKRAPITSTCILAANFALCGLPFIAGFYSKDLILETIITSRFNLTITSLGIFAVTLTSFYSLRFSYIILWGPQTHFPTKTMSEPIYCVTPILLISITSVLGGSLIFWLIPNVYIVHPLATTPKFMVLSIIILGLLFSVFFNLNTFSDSLLKSYHKLNFASCIMWFLTPISSQLQLIVPLSMGHHFLKSVDHSWLELAGGQGVNKLTSVVRSQTLLLGPKSPTHNLLVLISIVFTSIFLIVC